MTNHWSPLDSLLGSPRELSVRVELGTRVASKTATEDNLELATADNSGPERCEGKLDFRERLDVQPGAQRRQVKGPRLHQEVRCHPPDYSQQGT